MRPATSPAHVLTPAARHRPRTSSPLRRDTARARPRLAAQHRPRISPSIARIRPAATSRCLNSKTFASRTAPVHRPSPPREIAPVLLARALPRRPRPPRSRPPSLPRAWSASPGLDCRFPQLGRFDGPSRRRVASGNPTRSASRRRRRPPTSRPSHASPSPPTSTASSASAWRPRCVLLAAIASPTAEGNAACSSPRRRCSGQPTPPPATA